MKNTGAQQGFTLLEILIASAVFTIVLFAIYGMFVTNQTTYDRGVNKVEIQQNARVAMEAIAREIRMAGYDPSDAINLLPSTAIEIANANDIRFIADVTGDAVSDQVRHWLAGNQVMRDISSWNAGTGTWDPPGSGELAASVSTLTFQYFDANDVGIPAPVAVGSLTDIRRITIGITAQGTAAGIQETFPLTIDVRVRNAD